MSKDHSSSDVGAGRPNTKSLEVSIVTRKARKMSANNARRTGACTGSWMKQTSAVRTFANL
eukprot:14398449-Heterocapsa_arctica.AAC.1